MKNLFKFLPLILIPLVIYAEDVTFYTSSGVVAKTGALTLGPMDLRNFYGVTIQASWAVVGVTSPSGSFSIKGSNDYTPDTSATAHWTSLTQTITGPSGNSSNSIVDIPQTAVPWMEMVYTNIGGTGSMVMSGFAKVKSSK